MLLLLKNNLNFFKGNIFECFFKEYEYKTLSVEEYLSEIRSYLEYIINNFKKYDLWKIQLTIAVSNNSICCSNCVKLWGNRKTSWKNNKNYIFYK